MPFGKKFTRKQKIICLAALALSGFLVLYYYFFFNDARKFRALTEELFYSELSENTLSLHYTLAYPEEWGFTGKAVLTSYEPEADADSDYTDISRTLERLSGISRNRLGDDDAYAYDLLTRYLTLRLAGTAYPYYGEPMAPSSGMQSGLPTLLADYTFRSEKDVEDYLQLLDQTDTYFQGMIQYEKEKSQNGLFMSDAAAGKIIKQCTEIMDRDALSSGTHFLHDTFKERLDSLEKESLITDLQKEHWISENDRLLTTVMAPAYEEVADAFTVLSGTGANSMGLSYFPDGSDYYEYLLAFTTGSSRSIPEIKAMLWDDFQRNIVALVNLYNSCPGLSSMGSNSQTALPLTTPEEMLEDLQRRITDDFPDFPAAVKAPESKSSIFPAVRKASGSGNTAASADKNADSSDTSARFVPGYTIKSVSPSMENYTSPAYYLTPPVDDMRSNIIYINHKNSPDALTLYTTLAHEGYPGHLYQTVYSQIYLHQQNASPIRYLLHYGGYVEGWALYVENLSYGYAQQVVGEDHPLEALWFEACRLDRNLQLCLYSLLDIAIHHEGATPAQVRAILAKMGITSSETASAIYQYIVEEPVNYLKYYLGYLEFLNLRDTARELWKEDFTLRRFHQFVLETGPSDFQGLYERLAAS